MQHVNSRGFTCNWTSSSANTWRWPGPRRRRCTCSIFKKLQTFKRRLSISYVLVVEQRGGGNFGRLRFAQRDVNFIHRLFEWVKQSPKAIIVESRKKTANESAAAGCNTLIRRNVAAARQLFNKPTILPWILPDWVAFCPARWRSGIPSWASQCNRLAFVHTWSAGPKKNPLTIQFNPQHHPPSW